jgi:hypothetical protein
MHELIKYAYDATRRYCYYYYYYSFFMYVVKYILPFQFSVNLEQYFIDTIFILPYIIRPPLASNIYIFLYASRSVIMVYDIILCPLRVLFGQISSVSKNKFDYAHRR